MSLNFTFRKGLAFHEEGRLWTLIRGDQYGKFHFESDCGKACVRTRGEVLELWLRRTWVINEESLTASGTIFYLATERDFDSYQDHLRKRAVWKRTCVEWLIDHGVPIRRAMVDANLDRLLAECGEAYPASTSSLLRWHRQWMKRRDERDLVDRREKAGRRKLQVQPDLVKAALRMISAPVITVGGLFPYVEDAIDEYNSNAKPADRVKKPSRATWYRHGKKILQHIKTGSGFPQLRLQLKKVVKAVGGVFTSRVLERVEIDFHELDIIPVSAANGATLTKAWIIVALDHFSRMVLGFYISLDPPNAAAVVLCLKHAILPKSDTVSRYPEIVSPYPACGLPMQVVTDNGSEMWARQVHEACEQLHLRFLWCPPDTPEAKGTVERFFETLEEQCIHTAHGTTFSNPASRGDYPSESEACYDIQTLIQRITIWIVDSYHRDKHSTIGMPPLRRWESAPNLYEIEYPADVQDFDILSCRPESRTLQRYGIEYDRMTFQSEVLHALYGDLEEPTAVRIKVPDDNVNYLYVQSPIDKTYLQVWATKGAYPFPVPRYLHKMKLEADAAAPTAAEDRDVVEQTHRKLNVINREAQADQRKRTRSAAARKTHPNSDQVFGGKDTPYAATSEAARPTKPKAATKLPAGLDDELPFFDELPNETS